MPNLDRVNLEHNLWLLNKSCRSLKIVQMNKGNCYFDSKENWHYQVPACWWKSVYNHCLKANTSVKENCKDRPLLFLQYKIWTFLSVTRLKQYTTHSENESDTKRQILPELKVLLKAALTLSQYRETTTKKGKYPKILL